MPTTAIIQNGEEQFWQTFTSQSYSRCKQITAGMFPLNAFNGIRKQSESENHL